MTGRNLVSRILQTSPENAGHVMMRQPSSRVQGLPWCHQHLNLAYKPPMLPRARRQPLTSYSAPVAWTSATLANMSIRPQLRISFPSTSPHLTSRFLTARHAGHPTPGHILVGDSPHCPHFGRPLLHQTPLAPISTQWPSRPTSKLLIRPFDFNGQSLCAATSQCCSSGFDAGSQGVLQPWRCLLR